LGEGLAFMYETYSVAKISSEKWLYTSIPKLQ